MADQVVDGLLRVRVVGERFHRLLVVAVRERCMGLLCDGAVRDLVDVGDRLAEQPSTLLRPRIVRVEAHLLRLAHDVERGLVGRRDRRMVGHNRLLIDVLQLLRLDVEELVFRPERDAAVASR